ncbi:MAG: hypothetical protein NT056_06630 [Proteobacteria bacterium]|nr:hypothetical protein [Pseudomonadota bacterium]
MSICEWRPISRELNAWHYDEHPDYWQWLYFDFVFSNDYTACAVILPRSVGSVPGVSQPVLTPEVWLTIRTPEGKRYDVKKAYPLSDSQGSRKGLDVRVGKNLMKCSGDRYQIKVKEGEIGVDLELISFLPPWTPMDDLGCVNPDTFQQLEPTGRKSPSPGSGITSRVGAIPSSAGSSSAGTGSNSGWTNSPSSAPPGSCPPISPESSCFSPSWPAAGKNSSM